MTYMKMLIIFFLLICLSSCKEKEQTNYSEYQSIIDVYKSLDTLVEESIKTKIKNSSDSGTALFHFNLGLYMRNNMYLWSDTVTDLKRPFYKLGICHADDISGLLISNYSRYLNNKPLDIGSKANFYRNWWGKDTTIPVDTINMCPENSPDFWTKARKDSMNNVFLGSMFKK